jgi:hypothetical protein
MRIRSVLTHSGEALFEGLLVALMVVVLMAGTAFAAKGGGGGGHGKPSGGSTGGTGTISLVTPPVVDNNGNGTPNWHDTVRFNVQTTSTTQPYVTLYCYQNGVMVAGGTEGYFAGALDDGNFALYAPNWMGGAADCTAKLQTPSLSTLASTSFHVDS